MHYYPEDQVRENLEKIRRTNVCSVCGRQLSIYLDMQTKRKYVACSGQIHEGITREYKAQAEDYQSNIRRELELSQVAGTKGTQSLATIPKQGQLTQPQAMQILKLVYPKAQEDEIVRCAIFCRDFGLHPLAREVYLIPFKGQNVMVVGISASRKMAHARKGDFSFLDDTPRAATEEEVIKQFGVGSEEARDNIISVTKLRGVGGNLAIGFGLYSKKESPYGTDKGNTRRNMANIRSERQAIDRLPGNPMPKYEVIDETYIEVPDIGKVDTTTGEIAGEFSAVEETAPEPAATPLVPEPTQPAIEKLEGNGIDKAWVKKQLLILQGMKVRAWSNVSFLGRLDTMTGKKHVSISEALDDLSVDQAVLVTQGIKDAVDMS